MNNETRRIMMAKYREVYGEHIKALKTLKPLIEIYNGKVLDKKLSNALNAAMPEGLDISVYFGTYYGSFYFKLYNSNRSYKCVDQGICTHTEYVDNETIDIRIGEYEDVVDCQTSARGRLKAEPVIKAFDEEIKYLEKQVMEIGDAEKYGKEMVTELMEIFNNFEAFNKKHGSTALNLLGIRYSTHYIGDSDKRNYDVREIY